MNKPVAWMLKTGHGTKIVEVKPYCEVDLWTPLYTHPVKELTDEEIEECYWGDGYPDNPRHPKEFARAILRKANKK